jgi:release factor glutamine methyltransferase
MTTYFGITIKQCKQVYSPAEDTLLLAETIDSKPDEEVLDMGTGTGLLGLIAARKGGNVLAVDINDVAVKCANENAGLNNVKNFIAKKSDIFSNINGCFNLIIFNPPYLPTEREEPKDEISSAWDGGRSGRVVIDRFLWDVKEYLVEEGRILMLGSSLSNYKKTVEILEKQNFDISILASKKLDFEELVVIRATYDF